MPATIPVTRAARRRAPPVERAARLAAIWGWSYVVTIVALAGLPDLKPESTIFDWLLQTSLLFTILGVLELTWRRQLLKTRDAKWVRVLAANEIAGTLALIWCVAWLGRVPVAELAGLLSERTRGTLDQAYAAFGMEVDEQLILWSFAFSKAFCMYFIGGLLLLSQIWVIIKYLGIAKEMGGAPRLPPVLARG